MGNEIAIRIGAQEDATKVIEGIATETQRTEKVVVQSMGTTEAAFDSAARQSGKLGESLDRVSGASSQLSGGIGDVGGAMTAFTDLQKLGATRALEHQQALIDEESAQNAYGAAVKQYGADSLEARTAQVALNAAQQAAQPPTAIQQWGEKLELISPVIMAVTGATDLLIFANEILSSGMAKQAAGFIASKVAMLASSAASGIATAAQWALNVAMDANPIGLIILAIAALVAIIVLIATKTTWFQDIWAKVWGWIGTPVKEAWDWIKGMSEGVFNFIMNIPDRIGNAFSSLGNMISAPFKWAFNWIAYAWNNSVGRLSFKLPSWIPGIGGEGFSLPRLPMLATGGDIMRTGAAIVHKGERILPASTRGLGGGDTMGGGVAVLEIRLTGGSEEFRNWIKSSTKVFGGRGPNSVQIAWAGE